METKLNQFKTYYNNERAHSSLNGKTPVKKAERSLANVVSIDQYRWKSYAGELFQLPVAA